MPGELQVSQVPSVVGKELAGGGLGGVGSEQIGAAVARAVNCILGGIHGKLRILRTHSQ